MWDLILNPFITVLTLLYSLFGSAILAIVLFTLVVRLLTYPLSQQQVNSSKKMAALQPALQEMQKKYKNDREKLAQEQMRLYREHGVSPFGGCLTLLIQFPIWIGLYQAINHALAATPLQLLDLGGRFLIGGMDKLVPLNNTFLGIDLTQPPAPPLNPAYALALPVLVLITSWVQGKMMSPAQASSNADGTPNQAAAMTQSMTTMMPLMMGFFSLSFSVGLSVYFIVTNLLTIVQYSRNANFHWKQLIPFSKAPTAVPAQGIIEQAPKSKLEEKVAQARQQKASSKK